MGTVLLPETLYGELFKEAPIPLAILDEQGFVLESNDRFRLTFYALTGQDIWNISQSLPDFFSEREVNQFPYHFSRLITGSSQSVHFHSLFRNASAHPRWLHITGWLIPEKEDAPPPQRGPFIIIAVEDKTEDYQKTQQLQEEKEIANRAIATKSLFLANISHEIRTPLQTIIGMLELLEETNLNREQQEYTHQIRFSAEVLLSLVNDILDYSKIEAGKLELEYQEFPVEEIIEQAVDMIALEAHRKGLELLMYIPLDTRIRIKGDPHRLRQVLINLIKNAVKFTREGSVTVSIRRNLYQGKTALTFSVADTGIGVPPAIRPYLFTSFFQGDPSTTRKFGGTGLGLAISRHLVQSMGGEIGMVPNEGKGSIFSFTIPIEESPFPLDIPYLQACQECRILIVDDVFESRQILTTYLHEGGYRHIEGCASGEEALTLMIKASDSGRPYDLVFIDMLMPRMDGWRLAAEINRNHAINSARLILMVSRGMMGAEAKMTLLQWFNGYITKPVKRRELFEVIQQALITTIDLEDSQESQEPSDEKTASGQEKGKTQPSIQGSRVPFAALPHTSFSLRILVVEDHPINQQLFVTILQRLGYKEVETANNGEEALARVKLKKPELIFLDIQMPGMNGYEVTQLLRQNGFEGPIIAVTASALSEEKEQCLTIGMNDILTKPYKRQDIAQLVSKWAGIIAQQKQAMAPFSEQEPHHRTQKTLSDNFQIEKKEVPRSPPTHTEGVSISSFSEEAEEIEELESIEEGFQEEEPIFAVEELLDNFLGEIDTVIPLLAQFLERTEGKIQQLPHLASTQSWEILEREAHTIKGSALNLGAHGLGKAAFKLEEVTKKKDRALIPLAIQGVEQAFSIFKEQAQKVITEYSRGEGKKEPL
ncbi:MAG: response regulator [Treponemataceae bacterium]|nr:response regulator [Treponemataceae bacterium]